MIKPKRFDQATNMLPSKSIGTSDGKVVDSNFYFYKDPGQQFVISCVELDKDDMKALRENGQKLWITLPLNACMAFQMQTQNPFTKINPDQSNEKKDETPKGPGDDKQPDKGDRKLSISGGALSESDKHSRELPEGQKGVD